MPTYNVQDNIGEKAPDFSLPASDGNTYSLSDFADKKLLVIIFMCNHCPYVKAVAGRFTELQERYKEKGVQFIAVNPNDEETYPEDSMEGMKEFDKEYSLNFPYLRDESQETAKSYSAVCTPDIYLYDQDRILRYRGRLDDSWKDETKVTQQDLNTAISLLLNDRPIDFPQVLSMGCSIKWKRN